MVVLQAGQKFERYRVVRQLGSGTSGVSYEAEDMMLQRAVTLKLIHPWSRLPDSARRQFFRDMQSISLLAHPYQAAMLDYGEVDGQLYIVRRFVRAGSLLNSEGRAWFAPPLAFKDAVTYAHQLAQALYNIHRYGYVHGSLTLANILVLRDPGGTADTDFAPFLLSDVGTAYFVRRNGRPQMARLPITAAPEQSRGRLTAASDQYALAVILYLWLAGRPPFLGSPEEIEQAKRSATFPLLVGLHPQVTLEHEGILRRALSPYPDERYPTVLAFIEALRTLQAATSDTKETRPLATLHYSEREEMEETLQHKAISLPTAAQTEAPAESAATYKKAQNIAALENLATETAEEQETPEPISTSFLLDYDALRRLTTLAKQEPEPAQPEAAPQIDPDLPSPRPGEQPPTPLPDPAQPAPQEAPVPAPDPEPGVIPPAPDIAQPLAEPELPPTTQAQPEVTPPAQPSPAAPPAPQARIEEHQPLQQDTDPEGAEEDNASTQADEPESSEELAQTLQGIAEIAAGESNQQQGVASGLVEDDPAQHYISDISDARESEEAVSSVEVEQTVDVDEGEAPAIEGHERAVSAQPTVSAETDEEVAYASSQRDTVESAAGSEHVQSHAAESEVGSEPVQAQSVELEGSGEHVQAYNTEVQAEREHVQAHDALPGDGRGQAETEGLSENIEVGEGESEVAGRQREHVQMEESSGPLHEQQGEQPAEAVEVAALVNSQDAQAVSGTQAGVQPLAQFVISSSYLQEPRYYTLEREETTIGRAGSSDLLLDYDATTSRHHALVRYEQGRYFIYDTRSAHGVVINKQTIPAEMAYPLANGDNIYIGEYTLVFQFPTQLKEAETTPEHAVS